MASQKGLGKGLGALLGDFMEAPPEDSAYRMLPLHRVEPNPEQPRQDFDQEELEALAESIRQHGIIQPLTVRETGLQNKKKYGESRLLLLMRTTDSSHSFRLLTKRLASRW